MAWVRKGKPVMSTSGVPCRPPFVTSSLATFPSATPTATRSTSTASARSSTATTASALRSDVDLRRAVQATLRDQFARDLPLGDPDRHPVDQHGQREEQHRDDGKRPPI